MIPGPWNIRDDFEGVIPIDGWDGDQSVEVCRVTCEDLEEARKVAPLISAAPDLQAAGAQAMGAYHALDAIIEDHPHVALLLPGLDSCKKAMIEALKKSGITL